MRSWGVGAGLPGGPGTTYDTFSSSSMGSRFKGRHVSTFSPAAAHGLTVVLCCLFILPAMLSIQLGMDTDVAYWIGKWGLLAYFIPIWIIVVHFVHAYVLRPPRPWKALFIASAIVPGVLLMGIGMVHLFWAGYLYGQLNADDCTMDAPVPDKRRLQKAYMEAFIIYLGCYQRMLSESAGRPLLNRPTLQDCMEWENFQEANGHGLVVGPAPAPATYAMPLDGSSKSLDSPSAFAPSAAGPNNAVGIQESPAMETALVRWQNWWYLHIEFPLTQWWEGIKTYFWESFVEPVSHLFGGGTSEPSNAEGELGVEVEQAESQWGSSGVGLEQGLRDIQDIQNTAKRQLRKVDGGATENTADTVNRAAADTDAWKTYAAHRQAADAAAAHAGEITADTLAASAAEVWNEFQKTVYDSVAQVQGWTESPQEQLPNATLKKDSKPTPTKDDPLTIFPRIRMSDFMFHQMRNGREFRYLADTEANHVCSGFCQPGPALFTDYDVTGHQGGKCAPIVALKFTVVQHQAQVLFWVSLIGLVVFLAIYWCTVALVRNARSSSAEVMEEFN